MTANKPNPVLFPCDALICHTWCCFGPALVGIQLNLKVGKVLTNFPISSYKKKKERENRAVFLPFEVSILEVLYSIRPNPLALCQYPCPPISGMEGRIADHDGKVSRNWDGAWEIGYSRQQWLVVMLLPRDVILDYFIHKVHSPRLTKL